MIKNSAFINNTDRYDDWFEKNHVAYLSELKAFEKLGISGKSIEIGVGTGKFAKPLEIDIGIEPTSQMYKRTEGIDIIEGVAENLPLLNESFDWVIMVTTICFVNDHKKAMSEMHRILKQGGKCAIGLVDKDTELGAVYLAKKDKSEFYKEATFFSSEDVIDCMTGAGFRNIGAYQTLTSMNITAPEEPYEGYGKGGFAVIYGEKS